METILSKIFIQCNNLDLNSILAKSYVINQEGIDLTTRVNNILTCLDNSMFLEFISFVNDLRYRCLYEKSDIFHGVSHIERVCFFAFNLFINNNHLNSFDLKLLIEAVKYHDCAKGANVPDNMHAVKSAEMYKDYTKIKNTNDVSLICSMIACHSEDSIERMVEIIEIYNLDITYRVLCLINIVRDADILDRIRFARFCIDPSLIINKDKLFNKNSILHLQLAFDFYHIYKYYNNIGG